MRKGRHPVPEHQRRTERVSVALSQAELDRVVLAALRLRMPPSEFIRLMVLPSLPPISVVNQ